MRRPEGFEPPGSKNILKDHKQVFAEVDKLRYLGYGGVVGLIAVRPLTSPRILKPTSTIMRPQVLREELLLVRRKEGVWGNPAGHVEVGDRTIFEAVAWEALQETGLRTIHALDYVVSDLLDSGFTESNKYYLLFKAWVRNNFIPQLLDSGSDLDAVCWFDAETAHGLLGNKPIKYQKYLQRYLKGWPTSLRMREDSFLKKSKTILSPPR